MTIEQFTHEFELSRAQLRAYIFRITASKADADDIVQETYLKASQKMDSFRGESTLRTWFFTIASNLAKDNFRARKRWTENVTDICKADALSNPSYFPEIMRIHQSSPHGQFEIREHISFCLNCVTKSLPLEQQICVLLKEIHGFKVMEIAEILDTTEAMIKYYLHVGRSKLVQIFNHRCALINKDGVCHQCSELNGIFNPMQNFEVEKNKLELAKTAEKADKQHLLDLRMKIMHDIDPFHSNGSDLQVHHLEYNRKVMEKKVSKFNE